MPKHWNNSRRNLLILGIVLALVGCGSLQWPPPSDMAAGTRAAGSLDGETQRPQWAASRPTTQIYVRVKSGETLFDLSRRQGISARTIIDANRLRPPYKLRPGQRLKIPPPRRYRVVRGDTLYGISRRFRVAVFELARLNRLTPPYNIFQDQLLSLPGGTTVAEPYTKTDRKTTAKTKPGAKPISLPPVAVGTKVPRGRFIWPVSGRIVSGYGPKGEGLHNDGINIAAPRGSPVRAASAGTVAYAGNELRGFGNLLLIRHGGGWVTAYAHNQELLVKRGDKVSQGQAVARVGSTGRVKEPQLHFEIRRGRRAIDPARQLAAAPASS